MKKRILYLLLLQLMMANTMGQTKVKKTYFKSSKQIEFIEYVKGGIVIKLISFYKDGKKKKEKNFDEEGKLSGYQVEFSETGYKIKEMFVMGVESIPYNLIVDTADSENLIEIVNYKEINYHSNGENHVVSNFPYHGNQSQILSCLCCHAHPHRLYR